MKHFATISVIGRDKTGVIARFTNFLFHQGANIEALEEQVTRGQFSMVLQASWVGRLIEAKVRQGLAELGREMGMEVTMHLTDPRRPQNMAVMVTREAHCFEAVMRLAKRGSLRAKPVIALSNRQELAGLAKEFEIPFAHVPWEGDRQKAEETALRILQEHNADFVVLARFMKILSPNFVWRYKNKIINVHPSLLPSFPGPQAYRQAYEHGVKIVGVTSHFVSMHLDEGPIIAQAAFQVRPRMTLKEMIARGQALESKVLIRALRLYLAKKLDVHWGVVKEI